ncbi:MAG: GLUG motif-containing protein, partial [Clostridia bacterium]|nr:GLUG motif-containing protein [Clostridia bacterium]
MRRTIAIFLTLLLAAALLPAPATALESITTNSMSPEGESKTPADPVSVWDGTIATGYAGGNGDEDNPYLIETGSQLAYLAQQTNADPTYTTNKYFKLTKDIVLNDTSDWQSWGSLDGNGEIITPDNVWTTIGAGSHFFNGIFDGNDKTVSGIYLNGGSNQGLFGYCDGATIQGVGVTESYISGTDNIGGVVGFSLNSTVTNCYNAGMVSGTGVGIGGVVGYAGVYSAITYCYNRGTVSSTGNSVGGIAGTIYIGSLEKCYNLGSVSGANYVGGLVGNSADCAVTKSYNAGEVIANGLCAGGVVGWNEAGSVTNCYNTAKVNGVNFVGGVVGYNLSSRVSTCYNIGNIIGKVEGGNTAYIGGVVGCNSAEIQGTTAIVENCYYIDSCGADVGVTNGGGEGTETIDNVSSLIESEFRQEGYYVGFDFEGSLNENIDPVWVILVGPSYYYAQLKELRHYTPITGIAVTKSMELGIGGTEEIETIITPEEATIKNVKFESSDETVATVSDAGEVTGVAAGTATITTTTRDGGFTGTTTVTVHADCTVTYTADNVQVAQYQVHWGNTLETIPDVPAKEGHDQVAPTWNTDLANFVIKQDYDVEAVYTINTYTVTYVADGENVGTYNVNWNDKLTEIPNIPAKEGYDQVAPTWSVDLTDVAIKQDYEVEALYTINTYTVTYTADGETVAQYTVNWNDTLTEIPNVPAKEGHDQVAPTWSVDLANVAIKQDYTVNAVYTINTYTVTYIVEGEQVAQYTINWGGTLTEIPEIPAKEGHTDAWSVDLMDVAIKQDYEVEAVYTINTYTVTYTADGETVAQYTINWSDTLTEIPEVPDKPHHITVGWDMDLAGLAIKQDYEVKAIYIALLYGDANCDNEVDAGDASLILRYVVGLSNISEL